MSLQQAMAWRALGMLARAREARELIQHSGLYGEHNEGLLIETLRELLPGEWEVGSGEVMDVDGLRSPQCDVIIYNGQTFPPAHRSKTGKVVVFAHAVGAVIEVKSTIHNATSRKGDGDVQDLGVQLAKLRAFLDAAMDKGTTKIHEEAGRQRAEPALVAGGIFSGQAAGDIFGGQGEIAELDAPRVTRTDMIDRPRVPLYGFAYSSLVSADAIAKALPVVERSPDVFVLDAPRSVEEIRGHLPHGRRTTKADLLQFAADMRDPNGYAFHVHAYNQGPSTTVQVDAMPLGTQALRTFVKELSDTIRRESPLIRYLAKAAEIVYSAYNPWEGTYEP